mgnify:CR=1 FL=1
MPLYPKFFMKKILLRHHKRLRKCHAKFVTDVL